MGISAEATEAKATALITEIRRCISIGVPLQGQFLRDVLAQLQSATVNDLSGRTDRLVDNLNDGRSTAEVVVIT
jgi:hypothetical protein